MSGLLQTGKQAMAPQVILLAAPSLSPGEDQAGIVVAMNHKRQPSIYPASSNGKPTTAPAILLRSAKSDFWSTGLPAMETILFNQSKMVP